MASEGSTGKQVLAPSSPSLTADGLAAARILQLEELTAKLKEENARLKEDKIGMLSIIRDKQDPDSQWKFISPQLLTALESNNVNKARLLVEVLSEEDLKQLEEWEETSLLSLAADKGHAETCQMLLDQGRDVNKWASNADPPLHAACEKGHSKIVEMFLAVNDIEVNNWGQRTALNIAIECNHLKAVKMLLDASGIQVNCADDEGWTPLTTACREGHSKAVKMLLAVEGIQVNQADPWDGRTPLSTACQGGHSKVVKILLAVEGIQVNQANKKGFTPLMTALNQSHIDIVMQLFQHGIGHNNINEWFRINKCKISGRIALYKYALLLPQQHQPLLAFHSCVLSAKNALVPTSALKVFKTIWPPLIGFTIESFLLPTKQTKRTMQQVISHFNATLNDHGEHGRTPLYDTTCHADAESIRFLLLQKGILINKFSRHILRRRGVNDIVRYRTPLYEAQSYSHHSAFEIGYIHRSADEKSRMNDIIIPLLRAAGGRADYQSREQWLEQQIL